MSNEHVIYFDHEFIRGRVPTERSEEFLCHARDNRKNYLTGYIMEL